MKFYVLEYQPQTIHGPPNRVLETSKTRALNKMYEALQLDAFPAEPGYNRPIMPRMFIIDIPTPVKQSTVKSLIKGEIYQYIVDEDGSPNPQPNPAHSNETMSMATVRGTPTLKDLRRKTAELEQETSLDASDSWMEGVEDGEPDEEGISDLELEEQGQEPMPF